MTLVGAVAGLAGCIAMNLVSYFWARAESSPAQFLVQHGARPDVASSQAKPAAGDVDTATAKLATGIARSLLDQELSREEQDRGGKMVHYGYGASVGALYSVSIGRLSSHDVWTGLVFGLCVWAGGVLIGLPAFKLASGPRAYTLSEHTFGVVGHLAYGLVLSTTYRVLDQS